MPAKLILDVDTGTDDAIAIMVACLHPGLDLVGCTTVFGNTAVEHCTENTLRVLGLLGRTGVPVHEGAGRPLLGKGPDRPLDPRAKAIHGDALPLPPASSRKADGTAVEFLLETYRRATDDITLVAVAPLTNVALALAADPTLARRIPRLVVMGGGHGISNSTPAAEHNIWLDPEAAAMVFAAGIARVDLVTLDATHEALVSAEDCRRLAAIGTPVARAAAAIIGQRISGYDETQPMARPATAPVHDALAVAALLDPTLLRAEPLHVDVETAGRLTRGRTVVDLQGRGTAAPNAHVALAADGPRFLEFLVETFANAARA